MEATPTNFMSEKNPTIKIMVFDIDNESSSIIDILRASGIDCELISAEQLNFFQEEKTFPDLRKFNFDTIKLRDVPDAQENCWWRKFSGNGKKAPRY